MSVLRDRTAEILTMASQEDSPSGQPGAVPGRPSAATMAQMTHVKELVAQLTSIREQAKREEASLLTTINALQRVASINQLRELTKQATLTERKALNQLGTLTKIVPGFAVGVTKQLKDESTAVHRVLTAALTHEQQAAEYGVFDEGIASVNRNGGQQAYQQVVEQRSTLTELHELEEDIQELHALMTEFSVLVSQQAHVSHASFALKCSAIIDLT